MLPFSQEVVQVFIEPAHHTSSTESTPNTQATHKYRGHAQWSRGHTKCDGAHTQLGCSTDPAHDPAEW